MKTIIHTIIRSATVAAFLLISIASMAQGAGFSTVAPLTDYRTIGHTTTLLPNGKVLVVAGWGNTGVISSAELYDPATNSWSSAGNISTTRSAHTATLLPNGKVLVAGGIDSNGNQLS